ncbi:Prolamin-like domain [Sesbania bispinosa]|nr:Prolamin-like domain [Sesbania bispinosa]
MALKQGGLFLLTLACIIACGTATRDLVMKPKQDLSTRLQKTNGDLVDCWSSLLELRSCSNEIVLFFINGEADIGPECCRAITVITHNCWPAMLTSLGFTAEEGNILRGYCDAAASTPALAPYGAAAANVINI